jgi:hypothetical protein
VLRVVRQVKTKIQQVGSRHTIYLKKELIDDSGFPFKVGDPLIVKIESGKLVVEKES